MRCFIIKLVLLSEKAYIPYAHERDLWKSLLLRFEHLQHHIFVSIGNSIVFEYLLLKRDNDILYSKLYEQLTEKYNILLTVREF